MKNNSGIITKIKHFNKVFKDNRTYDTFTAITVGILCLKNWKQGDLANVGGKTLAQIQYFFYKSNWSYHVLNFVRINRIRNLIPGCGDKKSDICIFDGTIVTKNNKSSFSGLANWFYSNRDKKVVNGLEVFGASIYTKSGVKYVLNLSIFFKKRILTPKDKRKGSLVNEARRKFIAKTLSTTKSWLVVLDSSFKGANTCKRIFQCCKRHFLVRISPSQIFFDAKGNKYKIGKLLTEANATRFDHGRIWVFRNVFLKGWIEKGVKIPVTIIVYHANGAKNPMVLATSASLEDVYENMVRKPGDPSWKNRVHNVDLAIVGEITKIYSCFVLLYRKRWSIEECFKELKSYLCFEYFKVLSHEAIMKYFHVILVVHTLLTVMTYSLYGDKTSFEFVHKYLKEKRNITGITIVGVKLFIEMMCQTGFVGRIKGKHRKTLAKILKNNICLKSIVCLT